MGMDSLAPVSVMLPSVYYKPGGLSSPVLGGDSLTDSVVPSPLDHSWATLIDLKGTSKASCGPCDGAAIGHFGYIPSGCLPVLHPEWFCLIGKCGLVDCLLSDRVQSLPESLAVCIPLHLHFLFKIPLELFFKVMLTRNYSYGKPGAELATGIHQICWSNFSGAMRSRSVGTKESVYLLLEIRSRQLAYLAQLLQYSHELLNLCIGLRIQWRISLMTKAQVLT